MHHGGIVPGGCAYALDVLCQNTSFTAQLRTAAHGARRAACSEGKTRLSAPEPAWSTDICPGLPHAGPMHDRRQGEPAHHILRVQWCRARNPGAGRRCHELRSRRGVAGWSAVPLTGSMPKRQDQRWARHRLGAWPARTGVPGAAPARREGGETAGLQGRGWVLCFCVFLRLPKNQLVPGDGFQLAAKGCGIRNKGPKSSTLQ